MKTIGIILVVVGILALAYQGFSYKKTEKDAQLGPLTIQHEETKHVWIPPVIGGICLVVGAGVLIAGARQSA